MNAKFFLTTIVVLFYYINSMAQEVAQGPFEQLIIRGVTMIAGNGAPPEGPIDLVVENDKIASIHHVGYPNVPIKESDRPILKEGGKEIDASGWFLLPGFIDAHAHIGGDAQGANWEYVFNLWLAHGITTIREVGGKGIEFAYDLKVRAEKNEIIAPRVVALTFFGQGLESPISTPQEARQWVRDNASKGADGVKFFGAEPDIMIAALDEINQLGLLSACHHAQLNVARWNVLHSARAGLNSMEHWYGLPEALFDDKTIQHYPLDYNYRNEQHRFEEAGKLWQQAAEPYSKHWNDVMNELLELDFTICPTFNIYEASRDLHRTRRLEWHETYTLPSLWEFFQPSMISHGSYWHYWGTEQEIHWKNNYKIWMTFINEYKNRGGRVTVGSDSGFIFQLYGFSYIRELELFREAGFHPLEIIKAATLDGAELLGIDDVTGSIRVGKQADLLLIEENPLENLKVLYGTGAIKLNENNEVIRVGGVKYTISNGVIYDAKKLLARVKEMVDQAKEKEGFELLQPGIVSK